MNILYILSAIIKKRKKYFVLQSIQCIEMEFVMFSRFAIIIFLLFFPFTTDASTDKHFSIDKFTISYGGDLKKMEPIYISDTITNDTQDIWAFAFISNAPADSRIDLTWYFMKKGGDQTIYNGSMKFIGNKTVYSHISLDPPDRFPPGKYRVDLALNGNIKQSIYFKVIESSSKNKKEASLKTTAASSSHILCEQPTKGDYLHLITERVKCYPTVYKALKSLKLGLYADQKHQAQFIFPIGWKRSDNQNGGIFLEKEEKNAYTVLAYRVLPYDTIKEMPPHNQSPLAKAIHKEVTDSLNKYDTEKEKKPKLVIPPVVYAMPNYLVGSFEIEYPQKNGVVYREYRTLLYDEKNIYEITVMTTDSKKYPLIRFLGEVASVTFWSAAQCKRKDNK